MSITSFSFVPKMKETCTFRCEKLQPRPLQAPGLHVWPDQRQGLDRRQEAPRPDRHPHLRRQRERPQQEPLQGHLQPRQGQSQRVPHLGHLLHLTRVDRLRSGPESLRRWTRNCLTLNIVSLFK